MKALQYLNKKAEKCNCYEDCIHVIKNNVAQATLQMHSQEIFDDIIPLLWMNADIDGNINLKKHEKDIERIIDKYTLNEGYWKNTLREMEDSTNRCVSPDHTYDECNGECKRDYKK